MTIRVEILIAELGYLNTNVRLIDDSNAAWNSNSIKMGYTGKEFLASGRINAPYRPLVISHIGLDP